MCAMRGPSYVITLLLVFAMCLTSAEPEVTAVTAVGARQIDTNDAKAALQLKPSLQAAAPISAESLLQKIEEAFRDEKKYMAEALTRAEKAEKETKEKKMKINEVWEDRNRYKAASEAGLRELEAAHQHLEEVNREIEENHLSLALLDRKLVDARMTMLAWTMLEEDQLTHRGSHPSSTLTYERARTSLTPETLEGYLLQRAETFYHFQPDLKAIVESHSKLLSPAMEAAYLQTRMLFYPAQVMTQYGFPWRSIFAPLIAASWWIRLPAIVLTLALCVAVALRKIAAVTKMSHTASASLAGVKRIAKQAMADHMIADTERGPDGDGLLRQLPPAVMDESAPAGVQHALWRLFFAVSSSGKSE